VDVAVVVGRHLEPEVHGVAPADPDHRPGDLPLEGHVLERDTGLDLRDELLRAKGDVVFARFVPVHWRRHVGRVGRNPVDVDLAGGVSSATTSSVSSSGGGVSAFTGAPIQPATAPTAPIPSAAIIFRLLRSCDMVLPCFNRDPQ